MTDIHSHTNFSFDSKETPENLVKQAIARGCKILGFSEHLDYDYKVNNLEVVMTDVGAYYKSFKELKEKYKNDIKILFGIEAGYDIRAEGHYSEVFAKYDFDYVINSVHIVSGNDCYFPAYFEDKTKEQAYTAYLQAVLKSIYAEMDYQIIGHLGYVVRNAPYSDKVLRYGEYKNLIDDILKGVIERQKILEINTNVRAEDTATLPAYEIIKRYYDMGGRLFSYGSDCHSASRLCDNYKTVTDMLKGLGIKETAYSENRQIKFYPV